MACNIDENPQSSDQGKYMSHTIEYVIYGIQSEKDWTDWVNIIISPVLAIIALSFTWRQNTLSKRHNRLMVTPHLDGMTLMINSETHHTYQYFIINNGVGPAILNSSCLTIDDVEIGPEDPIPTAVRKICPNIADVAFEHESAPVGAYIPAGTTVELVKIHCATKAAADEVKEKMENRARLTLTYKSIYDELHHFDSKD
jgi:hypothetical protein